MDNIFKRHPSDCVDLAFGDVVLLENIHQVRLELGNALVTLGDCLETNLWEIGVLPMFN